MTRAGLLLAVLVVLGLKAAFAVSTGLLADEAYHWTWSLAPGLGYHDQPPMIAWLLAAARTGFGNTELGLRAVALVCTLVVVAALVPHARDRSLWVLWSLGLPPLAVLTTFAVPDAPLLAGWSVAVSGALVGGPWGWALAALGATVAALSKHTGLLVLPLLIVAADRAERRTAWPWLALAILTIALLPHVVWLARHDWVTLRFQGAEGLWNARPPGVLGPLVQLRDQLGFVTPLAWAAAIGWLGLTARSVLGGTAGRVERMAWWTSAPLLVLFAVAAAGGPPEAHWPAPAWIGAGLGLATSAAGRLQRWAWTGAWLAALLTLSMAVHVRLPLLELQLDPADQLFEGPALGEAVGRWVLPAGVAAWEPGVQRTEPVYTERYQEAALIHFYTGIPARTVEGCGRTSQYDQTPEGGMAGSAWFVRPSTSGPLRCPSNLTATDGPELLAPSVARRGRVGPWQLFRISLAAP